MNSGVRETFEITQHSKNGSFSMWKAEHTRFQNLFGD